MSKELFCEKEMSWSDFYWSGEDELFNGVELIVNSENEQPVKPCARQEDAWIQFSENYRAIYPDILNAIYNFYIKTRPQYIAAGSPWAERMPEILHAKEVEKMINLESISISWPYAGSQVVLGLTYSCLWEEEHGLGVVLCNNKVVEVGHADCAIV